MRWMLLALATALLARPGFALPLKLKDGTTGPVVEGAKLNDGLVKSGMGYFVVTMNLPFDCLLAGRQINMAVEYIFKEKEYRYTALPFLTDVNLPLEAMKIKRTKEIPDSVDPYNLLNWGITVYGEPIGRFLERHKNARLIGREKIEGEECYVVEISPADLSPRRMYVFLIHGAAGVVVPFWRELKLWINPNKGYRVQKVEDKINGRYLFTYLIELRRYPGNIYFPKSIWAKVYDSDREELIGEYKIICEREFLINPDILDRWYPEEDKAVFELLRGREVLCDGFDIDPMWFWELDYIKPVDTEAQTWGSIKAMFR